jgi:hypothetical protein
MANLRGVGAGSGAVEGAAAEPLADAACDQMVQGFGEFAPTSNAGTESLCRDFPSLTRHLAGGNTYAEYVRSSES